MKIHILGGPGSGKTTLAAAIAAYWQVPHYDLDQLSRANGSSPARYVAETMSILRQPGWVSEGVYLLFVDPLLAQADRIVFLDISWPTAAYRIVRRHVTNSLRGTNQYPGLRLLYLLLKYARAYYRSDRPDAAETIRAYYAEYGASPETTPESLLARLENYPTQMVPPTAAVVRRYLEPYQEKVSIIRSSADQQRLFTHLAYS